MAWIMFSLAYLMKTSLNHKYLRFDHPRVEAELHISGAGVQEEMRPGVVCRPGGTGDRLMMLFHDPALIADAAGPLPRPADTLMLWEDGAGHHYGNPDNAWSHSWVHFHGDRAAALLAENGFVSGRAIPFPEPEVMERHLLLLHRELTGPHAADAVILRNLFECMLREMSRVMRKTEHLALPERLHRAKNFIERRQTERLSLRQLAGVAKLSVPHFCAEFKRHLGVSPLEYQLRLRFELAKYLLGDHNLNVAEVAQRVGYPDIFQFSKMFRRRLGQSPSEFRRGRR